MSEVYIHEPETKGKVILRTTHGDLEVELWAKECPQACRNFCTLVLEGFYDGTIFHRVISEFIIQGGDKTGIGDNYESIYGQDSFPDEIHPRLKFRYRGMMGVASAGKNTKTNGSQFFIILNRAPSLDNKHTLFAKVVGQTIYNLVRMSEVTVDKNDRPLEPPRIERAELVWDPFGDLEPRRRALPPSIPTTSIKERHRRAPVKNKRVLSFGASDGEDEEDDEAPLTKGSKSAHDLLDDPKLLRDPKGDAKRSAAAGDRHGGSEGDGRAPSRGESRREAAAVPAASTTSGREPKRTRTALDSESEGRHKKRVDADPGMQRVSLGSSDESDGSDDSEDPDDVAVQRSQRRQQEILKLKQEIVKSRATAETPAVSSKSKSALEEQRAGYKSRKEAGRSGKPAGREGRRQDQTSTTDRLGDFRDRLRGKLTGADEDAKDGGAAPRQAAKREVQQQAPLKVEPEEGTFAAIWEEGEEELDKDWLNGGGLNFHTSADKAFKLQADKARETLEIFDPLAAGGNHELLADIQKRRSEQMQPIKVKRDLKKNDKGKGDGKGDRF